MKLSQVLEVLRALAPERLAEPWDAAGLQIGSAEQTVTRGMLCIDLTEPVLDEAITKQADLVVAYHPPIFKPLPALTDADAKQRIALRAARAGMAIYSPHTALDAVADGVNDWLASGIGEGDVRPIRPTAHDTAHLFKLVAFVPEHVADHLRAALSQAGAGVIGHYTECSFNLKGEGTFRGDETTSPAVGAAERFERVPELRMEMVLPAARLSEAVHVLHEEHPYEEPAFDVYPLHDVAAATTPATQGQGRVVELKRPVQLPTLVRRLKQHLSVKHLEVARSANKSESVRRVGLCAGAGGSLLAEAGDVDVFITGEMRHHDLLAALAQGVAVVLAGHTQTERPYLPIYRDRILAAGGADIPWLISKMDRPPSTIR
ncbi:MAG: Nif3-like dinuclear metal center hexameric protein [Phycisphaeraceae bacterium]